MPKRYPAEFRQRALALVKAGRSIAKVASDLEVSQATVYKWRNQQLIDAGLKAGLSTVQSAELVAANRRIRELEEEVEILRRASVALKELVPPKHKFPLIADLGGDGISVKRACQVLQVTASGYYAWRDRPPSPRTIRHAWLTDLITEVHADSRGVYGAHRVRAELVHGRGILVGHNAVAMLMSRAGLHGLPNRKVRYRPAGIATAADLVDRQFARTSRDQLWVTDITEHPTREGKLFRCVVLDVYSRRVVGWSIDAAQTATLATNALGMAINSRKPGISSIIHSDHGTQGGFNWLSQHLDGGGVDGQAGGVDEGVDGTLGDEVAGRSQASARCGARVLACDRHGYHQRGRCRRGWRVTSGGLSVVPSPWRHAFDWS